MENIAIGPRLSERIVDLDAPVALWPWVVVRDRYVSMTTHFSVWRVGVDENFLG
jgi:hypothetical protein